MSTDSDYILMVNDDIDEQQLFLFAMHGTGLDRRMRFADDGWELINTLTDKAIAKEKLPNWIILDTDMPKLNGMQALKLIREVSIYEKIRIYMYGKDVGNETPLSYIKAGSNYYLKRPNSHQGRKEMALYLKQNWETELRCANYMEEYRRYLETCF